MSYYRLFLFIIFMVVLGLIFLQSQIEINLFWIGSYFLAQLSSGMSATVPPNPVNTLVQQLKEKEEKIIKKEQDLAEKEILLEKQILEKIQNQQKKDKNLIILFLILVSLGILFLIGLNFYLDWRRTLKLKSLSRF